MLSLVRSSAGNTAFLPSHETCHEPADDADDDDRLRSSSSHSIIKILVPLLLFPASNSKRAKAVIEMQPLSTRGVSVAANSLSGVNGAAIAAVISGVAELQGKLLRVKTGARETRGSYGMAVQGYGVAA